MTNDPPGDDFYEPPDDSGSPEFDSDSNGDDSAQDSAQESNDGDMQSQKIQHQHISALVPESVARGVFSTGAVVLQGAHEFILDFLVRMQQPQQVAARVILPPSVVPQFLGAMKENIRKYEARFGTIVDPVKKLQQPQQPKPSAQDLYDALKLTDEVMSGTYANAVMIGHSAYEFSFDFITTFFPRSAVACRVFLSAPNVPRLFDSLTHSFEQFRRQRGSGDGENPFGTQTYGDG